VLQAFGVIHYSSTYLNTFMGWLHEHSVSIIGDGVFVILSVYLLFASIRGNLTYGARTACFTFYPIT